MAGYVLHLSTEENITLSSATVKRLIAGGSGDAVLQAIAFTLILLGVFFVLTLAGKMIEGIVRIVMLGWLNKLLGVVFALLKVLLAIGLFILIFDSVTTALEIDCSKTVSGSLFYTPIKDFADVFFPYMKELIFNK